MLTMLAAAVAASCTAATRPDEGGGVVGWLDHHSGVAAWAQAFGGLAVIWATLTQLAQARAQVREQRAERFERIRSQAQVTFAAFTGECEEMERLLALPDGARLVRDHARALVESEALELALAPITSSALGEVPARLALDMHSAQVGSAQVKQLFLRLAKDRLGIGLAVPLAELRLPVSRFRILAETADAAADIERSGRGRLPPRGDEG